MSDKESLKGELSGFFDRLDNVLGDLKKASDSSKEFLQIDNSSREVSNSYSFEIEEENRLRNVVQVVETGEKEEKRTKLEVADNMLENVNNIFGHISNIANQYVEGKRLDVEVQKLRNELATIISSHQQEMEIIRSVFQERQMIFKKFFEIIDHGIENNNDELLINTMQIINNLAMINPLKHIESRKINNKIDLDNDEPLQLNF